jgi:galactokinase
MQTQRWLAAAAVAGLLAGGPLTHAADSKGEAHYSWVDKNGERHYGDSVPPEYSQVEQRVLNDRGVEINRVGAGKNAEQAAEQRRKEQEVAQREQHDRFLLTTYTSTKDIERLRDERVEQITGQIKATNAYIETLNGRLQSLQARAMNFKPYNTKPDARRMPDDLAEELVRTSNEVRTQKHALEDRTREQEAVRSQFQADIARFRELINRQQG